MTPDYDDPVTEEKWCAERQAEVAAYLKRERVKHGRIGEWPAWHVAPYVSIWAIESLLRPEWVGWWVICGDLPTDYISAETIKHPREVLRSIAQRWLAAADTMADGRQPPGFTVGTGSQSTTLAPLLHSRASTLLGWANDDSLWDDNAL